MSVVCRVRSMRQATVLLMSGGAIPASRCTLSKFVGLRQPEKIWQQSCRAGFILCACVDFAHTGQAYSAAEKQRARQLDPSVDACTPTSSSRVY